MPSIVVAWHVHELVNRDILQQVVVVCSLETHVFFLSTLVATQVATLLLLILIPRLLTLFLVQHSFLGFVKHLIDQMIVRTTLFIIA